MSKNKTEVLFLKKVRAGRARLTCARSVISEVRAPGNDGFDFLSAVHGGNSARLFPNTFHRLVLRRCQYILRGDMNA